ncbi:hypothetical protein, partial [Streptomyces erythrochromogenes]|uniref:hypothetical protein n=1 Tax=Streptomyces erythrochromogenes TaxID=285574 RepID=UPI0036B23369
SGPNGRTPPELSPAVGYGGVSSVRRARASDFRMRVDFPSPPCARRRSGPGRAGPQHHAPGGPPPGARPPAGPGSGSGPGPEPGPGPAPEVLRGAAEQLPASLDEVSDALRP